MQYKNTFVLKDIAGKSIKIIDINNNDFQELIRLENDNSEDFGFSTPVGGGGFFSTSTPFECITIENKEISYAVECESGYKDFFEQGNFDIFRSQDFAQKCARLLNLITAAYPNLKNEFSDTIKRKIAAPVIALFCYLTNESKLNSKGETESVKNYCKKVCNEFNLTYSDRVRQKF